MKFYDYLKNIFLILLLLQLAPGLIKSIKNQYFSALEPKTAVGVLKLRGVLYDSTYYINQLTKYFKNDEIKAILLKIECPGSASGTGEIIFSELQTLKKLHPKPVIALVENVCASGGYWIACAADHIIAPSTAIVGSIGAYFPYLFQLQGFMEHHHIGYETIQAGSYKTMLDPFTNMTPEQQAYLQTVLDSSYKQFTQSVAHTRNLSLTNIHEWGDGKIFTGAQAHQLGLIDELGGAHQAIVAIKERAPIEGEIEFIHPPKKGGLWNLFSGDSAQENGSNISTSMMDGLCTLLEQRYSHKTR